MAKKGSKHMMARPTKQCAAQIRFARLLPVLTLATLLLACSSIRPRQPAIPALSGHAAVEIPDADLLGLTPEMRAFADHYTKAGPRGRDQAWKLAYAALDPYLLNFDYDPMVTLTAVEAFQARRGNCLTFSGLFIALARDAGLDAWYQEVSVPPEWSAVNETLLVSKHVNAVVSQRGGRYVVDVSRRKRMPLEETRRLSDEEALAQYYNNLGADALLENDLALAHGYFRKALLVRPGLSYVWSNLGVVFRRNGQTEDAMFAYQIAIEQDPHDTVALNNLHTLYTEEGNIEAAAAIQRKVQWNRRNNPYYLHHLAEVATEEQRWADAIDLLNRAIRLEAREYRFHYTLALAQYYAGNAEAARSTLDRARELAPANGLVEPLSLPDGS